jgi:hypothetical protein
MDHKGKDYFHGFKAMFNRISRDLYPPYCSLKENGFDKSVRQHSRFPAPSTILFAPVFASLAYGRRAIWLA